MEVRMAQADAGRPGRRPSISIPGAPAAPPAGMAPPVRPAPLPEALSAWNDVLDRFSDRSTPGATAADPRLQDPEPLRERVEPGLYAVHLAQRPVHPRRGQMAGLLVPPGLSRSSLHRAMDDAGKSGLGQLRERS